MEEPKKGKWAARASATPKTTPNSHTSWRSKAAKKDCENCFKVNATDSTGREAYYFVKIFPRKLREFKSKSGSGTYDLTDYGEILYSAYGTVVPDDICQMLKEKYGITNC